MNGKAGRADLCFCVWFHCCYARLKQLIFKCASFSRTCCQQVTRIRRKEHAVIHGKLFHLGDRYDDENLSTSGALLRACASIIWLCPVATTTDDYELWGILSSTITAFSALPHTSVYLVHCHVHIVLLL